ncbi:MAG: DUF433 domain-containing protein [Planctomycetia bacterium]|nr:DUF433 domain-containing protein [Planctomycetia bacterium]
MTIEISPRITVDPAVRFGKPVIQGTRVPVSVLVGQAAAGLSHEKIAEEYGIQIEDVRAALEYAQAVVEQETVRVAAAP